MKFKKIVSVGIGESSLDPQYWQQVDSLCEKRISLAEDSPEVANELADADCLLVFFNGVPKDMIDAASNLKYIGALATGVGKIDTAYASSKGIIVTNLPGYSTESVAEFVFAVLLENLREIERGKRESREGNRSEAGFTGTEIKGKTFGLLGLGDIGSRVAEIAAGFSADVIYWSRTRKQEKETEKIKYDEVDNVISNSDFLSLHLALNPDTENFLNKERVEKIKSGAILINTAPMELINLNALEERLKKKDITFIFDHTDTGDISQENLDRLHKYPNCISYPVLGYLSKEARIAKQEMFVGNIKAFLENAPQNVVKD